LTRQRADKAAKQTLKTASDVFHNIGCANEAQARRNSMTKLGRPLYPREVRRLKGNGGTH
jgi:hypothetical protein